MDLVEALEEAKGAVELAQGGPVVHASAEVIETLVEAIEGRDDAAGDALVHRLWQAILDFHAPEGQDRCHDLEDRFFVAVGLAPKGRPPCTVQEWDKGCLAYQLRLFGRKVKETPAQQLATWVLENVRGEEDWAARSLAESVRSGIEGLYP